MAHRIAPQGILCVEVTDRTSQRLMMRVRMRKQKGLAMEYCR